MSKDGKYFTSSKKGDVYELQQQLNSTKKNEKVRYCSDAARRGVARDHGVQKARCYLVVSHAFRKSLFAGVVPRLPRGPTRLVAAT